MDFQLFRIKVFPASQRQLWERERTRPEILRETLDSLPSGELRKGAMWRIGNLRPLDDSGLYFRIGRTSMSKVEVFRDGEFADGEFESAPYTHVVLDANLEVCAVASKPKLAPRPPGIARQFERLLNQSDKARVLDATFEISEIADPDDFIHYLLNAYAVSRFFVTFTRPNAWDVDADFFRPLQRTLEESNGQKGKVAIEGESLTAERLERLARSAAATGDDARAVLSMTPAGQRTTKRLRGNSATFSYADASDDEERRNILQCMRALYRRIRGHDGREP